MNVYVFFFTILNTYIFIYIIFLCVFTICRCALHMRPPARPSLGKLRHLLLLLLPCDSCSCRHIFPPASSVYILHSVAQHFNNKI